MRIVLLTGHTPNGDIQHRFVARRLSEEFPNELAAIIVATGVRRGPLESVKRWWRRYSVRQIASRTIFRIYRKFTMSELKREKTLGKVLFPNGGGDEMPRQDIIIRVQSHNDRECLQYLNNINPDIVVVYGTLIIGKKVIAASKRMINIHTGFSPVYRGSDTIFWPLHNWEPHFVGVTVHRVDAGVDSGPILARGKPAIEPGDDENRLFAKSVMLGAELLCRAIRREFDGSAIPLPQDLSQGREFRSIDRTLAAELRTCRILARNLISEAHAAWWEEF